MSLQTTTEGINELRAACFIPKNKISHPSWTEIEHKLGFFWPRKDNTEIGQTQKWKVAVVKREVLLWGVTERARPWSSSSSSSTEEAKLWTLLRQRPEEFEELTTISGQSSGMDSPFSVEEFQPNSCATSVCEWGNLWWLCHRFLWTTVVDSPHLLDISLFSIVTHRIVSVGVSRRPHWFCFLENSPFLPPSPCLE